MEPSIEQEFERLLAEGHDVFWAKRCYRLHCESPSPLTRAVLEVALVEGSERTRHALEPIRRRLFP